MPPSRLPRTLDNSLSRRLRARCPAPQGVAIDIRTLKKVTSKLGQKNMAQLALAKFV